MIDAVRNVDQAEIDKFNAQAAHWWDPRGASRVLHEINPCRVAYIAARCTLRGARVLDVGCGGGILSEALAVQGAHVTGIDAAAEVVAIAREHAASSGLDITYACTTAEDYAQAHTGCFDVVTCLELLEHLPAPAALLRACHALLVADGSLFLSTLNRNLRSYLEVVLGAEYVLRLLPIGTHDYPRFITPAELAALLRRADFDLLDLHGMRYNPLTRRAHLTALPRVNYLVHARRR